MAMTAPGMPNEVPPARAATTTTAPGTLTWRAMSRGCVKYVSICWYTMQKIRQITPTVGLTDRPMRLTTTMLVMPPMSGTVSYTHLRAHETPEHLVCRLLL